MISIPNHLNKYLIMRHNQGAQKFKFVLRAVVNLIEWIHLVYSRYN